MQQIKAKDPLMSQTGKQITTGRLYNGIYV